LLSSSDEDDGLIREEDAFARKIGVHGVPCFVVDRKFMISGAQSPETFAEVFQRVRESADAQ
jgi:predicted DsbA family dithiol-disulfide isomerase